MRRYALTEALQHCENISAREQKGKHYSTPSATYHSGAFDTFPFFAFMRDVWYVICNCISAREVPFQRCTTEAPKDGDSDDDRGEGKLLPASHLGGR